MWWFKSLLIANMVILGLRQVPDIDMPNQVILGWNHELLQVDRSAKSYRVQPEDRLSSRTKFVTLDAPFEFAGTYRDGFVIVTSKKFIRLTTSQVQTSKLPTLEPRFQNYIWNEVGSDSSGNPYVTLVCPGDKPGWLKLTLLRNGTWNKEELEKPSLEAHDIWSVVSNQGNEGIHYKDGNMNEFIPFKDLPGAFSTFAYISTTQPKAQAVAVPAQKGCYIITYVNGKRAVYAYTASACFFDSVLGTDGALYQLDKGQLKLTKPARRIRTEDEH